MLVVNNPPANAGYTKNMCSIPGLGRSPGEGHINSLQYSCLGNPTVRGAWQAIVHRVAKSQTWLKRFNTTINKENIEGIISDTRVWCVKKNKNKKQRSSMELFKKLGVKSGIRNLFAASSGNTLLLLKPYSICEISSSHVLRDYCFISGVGNGNKLQYSCLENSTDKGASGATVHGITKIQTWILKPLVLLLLSCSVTSGTCDPMGCNTPGLPVLHHLPEFVQTHVLRVGDPIQISHPLSSLSPFAFILSQHQGSFPMNWLFVSKYWSPKYQCPKYWSFSISPSNVKCFYFLFYYQRKQISRSLLSHDSTQFLINVSLNPAF